MPPEHLPSLNQGWRQFRRGNLVSAWKFSFGVETSKIEEFRRKNKENQRNVGVAGRHGISGGFGVEPCSLWGFGVERAGWFGNVGCAAVGFAAGLQKEGHQPWGGRAHPHGEARISAPCASHSSKKLKRRICMWNLRSSIKYWATALPLFISNLFEVNNGSMLRPGVG